MNSFGCSCTTGKAYEVRLRDDSSLDVTVPMVSQVSQNLRQCAQRLFVIATMARVHVTVRADLSRPADVPGRVLDACGARDFRVAESRGTKRNLRSRWTATA